MRIRQARTQRIGATLRIARVYPTNVLNKLLALVVGAVMLVLGLMFSVILLAVAITLGLVAFGFFWWKTRKLRRAMRTQAGAGRVIDGESFVIVDEAVVVGEADAETKTSLPHDPLRS